MPFFIRSRTGLLGPVLVLAISLVLGACADSDIANQDRPVFFGNAGASLDGGGATSGMSLKW